MYTNLVDVQQDGYTNDLDLGAVAQAFAPKGALHMAEPHFRSRVHQVKFALAVEHAIDSQGKLVVEAGTGTGKTYAYLVPVLLSGRKTIISTATKGLQDQLFLRDLPHVRDALKVPVRVALLKGRSNYLCLYRFEMAQQEVTELNKFEQRDMTRVRLWAQKTRTGDLAEVSVMDERSPVIPLVSSTRENCLGSDCPVYRKCYLMQARQEAMAADVVVVNHHLFFADLAVRESGVAELLPTVDVVVFDEAHQLNEAGLQFLGVTWSTAQVMDFARDLVAGGLTFARGIHNWTELASNCEQAVRELRLVCRQLPMNARLPWEDEVPDRIDAAMWRQGLLQVTQCLEAAHEALGQVNETAPDLARLHERSVLLLQRLEGFNAPKAAETVRWVEAGASLRLIESPLDIAKAMQERCFQGAQAWVFTSATLGTDSQLSWFTQQVGLKDAVIERFDSPFDYATQAAYYVPDHFPRPNEATHMDAVADLAANLVGQLGGRAFVLTTSLRALNLIGKTLQERFEQEGKAIEVLVQGSRPKRELLEEFRRSAAHSVLVGSQSFWEGIDVAGDDLQLVIIDKLPFPVPSDPLVQARCARVEGEGGNAFTEISIPEAAVSLKQGAGRLIRSEVDRGLLVMCDSRLTRMSYGKRLLGALPPMQRLRSLEEVQAFISELECTPDLFS